MEDDAIETMKRHIATIMIGIVGSFESEDEPVRDILDWLEERLDPARPEDVSAFFDLPPADLVRLLRHFEPIATRLCAAKN
jgi:hypothetical protein